MATMNVLEARGGSLIPPAAQRGYHIFYRDRETNHCPGCGRTQWYIGRMMAECAFCATALAAGERAAGFRRRRSCGPCIGALIPDPQHARAPDKDVNTSPTAPALEVPFESRSGVAAPAGASGSRRALFFGGAR